MGLRRSAPPTRLPALLLVALLVAGCSSGTGTGTASPERTAPTAPTVTPSKAPSKAPTPKPVRLDTWQVGARPLPLRADGFGEVLPTPRELRVRRMQAADRLPPPRDGSFHGTVGPVTPEIRRRLGETWSASCPVGLDDLRYLTVTFAGFDGRAHTGELVVAASVARGVVGVFRKLYAARFPIEEMRLVTTRDLDAAPTGDGNNTAAYVCRTTRRATTFSAHASGLAIDLNPFLNPYRSGDLVLPELAGAYEDRSWRRPGMVLPGGVAVRAFAAAGWTWGGSFRTVSDLMHFTANGR